MVIARRRSVVVYDLGRSHDLGLFLVSNSSLFTILVWLSSWGSRVFLTSHPGLGFVHSSRRCILYLFWTM